MNLSRYIGFYYDLMNYLFRFYFFDEPELLSFQDRQFRIAIKSAFTNIIFYRNKFLENNIDLDKAYNLSQIRTFPFVTPEVLFTQPKRVRTYGGCSYMTLRSTGAVTGKPKDVYLSSSDWSYFRRLAYLRMFITSGCSLFDKTLFLRPPQSLFDIKPKWFWNIGLMREKIVSAAKSELGQIISSDLYKADVLNCLTDDSLALADLLQRENKRVYRLKRLFTTKTTGEVLDEKERQIIAAALCEKITDFYASSEAGIIAWQCSKAGVYHINADQVYVEITDGERVCHDGESGEVTITTLSARSSPLIRYKTGDSAVLKRGRCGCGSRFPSLSHITGRK